MGGSQLYFTDGDPAADALPYQALLGMAARDEVVITLIGGDLPDSMAAHWVGDGAETLEQAVADASAEPEPTPADYGWLIPVLGVMATFTATWWLTASGM